MPGKKTQEMERWLSCKYCAIFRKTSFCKSLKFFRTSIASLDPETVRLPAFAILSAIFTGTCVPPRFGAALDRSAHGCETRLLSFSRKAFKVWNANPNITILGSSSVHRLPIFSLLVHHWDSGKLLHHNFVSVLLNDLYGIQTRGGCACAGPYAQVRANSDRNKPR